MNKKILCLVLSLLVVIPAVAAQCWVDGQLMPCGSFLAEFGWIFVVIGVIFSLPFVFWLWMLLDCMRRNFDDKAIWIIILLLGNFLGAVIYYFVIKQNAHKTHKKKKTRR